MLSRPEINADRLLYVCVYVYKIWLFFVAGPPEIKTRKRLSQIVNYNKF